MNSSRAPFYFFTVLLVAASAFIAVQQNTIKRLTKDIAVLGPESREAKQLREDHAALAGEIKAIEERVDAEHRELLRLRGQTPVLREKEKEKEKKKEIAQLKTERESAPQPLPTATPPSASPLVPEETPKHRPAQARLNFSRQLGLSLMMFAADHQDQLPSSVEEMDTKALNAMPESAAHNIQAEQFEMVYKGRMDDLEDSSRTVLAREKEPVQRADGTWERVYVFVDGHSQILTVQSRAQFAQREKEKFILPSKP